MVDGISMTSERNNDEICSGVKSSSLLKLIKCVLSADPIRDQIHTFSLQLNTKSGETHKSVEM